MTTDTDFLNTPRSKAEILAEFQREYPPPRTQEQWDKMAMYLLQDRLFRLDSTDQYQYVYAAYINAYGHVRRGGADQTTIDVLIDRLFVDPSQSWGQRHPFLRDRINNKDEVIHHFNLALARRQAAQATRDPTVAFLRRLVDGDNLVRRIDQWAAETMQYRRHGPAGGGGDEGVHRKVLARVSDILTVGMFADHSTNKMLAVYIATLLFNDIEKAPPPTLAGIMETVFMAFWFVTEQAIRDTVLSESADFKSATAAFRKHHASARTKLSLQRDLMNILVNSQRPYAVIVLMIVVRDLVVRVARWQRVFRPDRFPRIPLKHGAKPGGLFVQVPPDSCWSRDNRDAVCFFIKRVSAAEEQFIRKITKSGELMLLRSPQPYLEPIFFGSDMTMAQAESITATRGDGGGGDGGGDVEGGGRGGGERDLSHWVGYHDPGISSISDLPRPDVGHYVDVRSPLYPAKSVYQIISGCPGCSEVPGVSAWSIIRAVIWCRLLGVDVDLRYFLCIPAASGKGDGGSSGDDGDDTNNAKKYQVKVTYPRKQTCVPMPSDPHEVFQWTLACRDGLAGSRQTNFLRRLVSENWPGLLKDLRAEKERLVRRTNIPVPREIIQRIKELLSAFENG